MLFAIDYHSYSQLVLRPHGWTSARPAHYNELVTAGSGIVSSIRATPGGVAYTSQSSFDLYITSGGCTDWFYGQAKVILSYTIELRDTGAYGFLLPASQIVITGTENWNAFIWLINHALSQ